MLTIVYNIIRITKKGGLYVDVNRASQFRKGKGIN